ncbi:MAG: AAA family ATPase [Acidimicrobiales bacterium]
MDHTDVPPAASAGDAFNPGALRVPPPANAPYVEEWPLREKRSWWDRLKILLGLIALFWILVWATITNSPLEPFRVALGHEIHTLIWLEVLAGLEAVRQIHYFISEHSRRWNHFWTARVFGRHNFIQRKTNDWTRFRVGRAARVVVILVLLAVILAAFYHTSPAVSLFQVPVALYNALPFIFQLAFAFFFIAFQFIGLFWLLSKGGVDVHYPGDIPTRFNDVWGQDAVVDRVKENLIFLKDPDEIESKGGYVPGGILLHGPPGTGKGQPVSALVMTPDGPRTMGSLVPGDEVIGSNGRPTTVTEVHLLGERDLFRVSFSDGSSLLVTEDHLWRVATMYGATHVYSTAELRKRGLFETGGKARFRIPLTEPVEFSPRELPLHPYLLGALLGDGTFRHHLSISSADPEVIDRVGALLPTGDSLTKRTGYDWAVIGGATKVALKSFDLWDHYSYEKFIPDDYKWSSVEQRLDLLRGLMDTDGTIDKRGCVLYLTSSPQLASDVALLVESLGGTTRMRTCTKRYVHGGQRRRGRPAWTVSIALPNGIVPVSLPRKLARLRDRTKYFPARRIIGIERDGREESRCIRVAAKDSLYVTERYVVTHNTLLAEAVAGETNNPFVFVDPGAFNNMFMGVGILKVKSLFRRLRKLALRYGGVVVFFDEADSLGNRGALTPGGIFGPGGSYCRGSEYVSFSLAEIEQEQRNPMMMGGMMGGGGGQGTLQSLLSEMQGLTKPRGFVNRYVRRALGMKPKPPPKYRILIMMASNMPQSLDEALLRPGRIDRIYKMGYPSKAGRIRTYEGYFAKVNHALTPDQIDRLATMTPYATGATIKDLVNESLINAIRGGRDVISWGDVVKAKQLKELGPPEDVEYIERERHATAVHEACHAVTAARSQKDWVIDLATIEKGSTYLGMVKHVRAEDTFTRWKSDYEADIMVSLASLAGERMFFSGDSASGVSSDLSNATRIATFMEGYWGMGRTVTSHEVSKESGVGSGGAGRGKDDETKAMFSSLGDRIESNLERILSQTEHLLKENHYEILGVAHALETRKTITGEDVLAIVNGTQGPFVDGRAYKTPEFRAALDEYHEAVVAAHRDRRGVEIHLPNFPVLPEVIAVATTGNGETPPPARRTRRRGPSGNGEIS